jgi:pimeloyl-ACP methyl ester carboxylesterase
MVSGPIYSAGGGRLEVLDLPGGAPELLLLHEGLGSVSMWRDFPQKLASATGKRVVAYSRLGFGRSSPRTTPYGPRFMHEEAREVLPELRARLGIAGPVLIGHSTGASMALLHAAHDPQSVQGVVAMAPLIDVEPSNLESIAAAREQWRTTDWRARLARHHDDVDAVFHAWNDTWLDPAFRDWSIARDLAAIACPVLAILGESDEYSSLAQLRALRHHATATRVQTLVLPQSGHAPHRDAPVEVLDAIARFAATLQPGP